MSVGVPAADCTVSSEDISALKYKFMQTKIIVSVWNKPYNQIKGKICCKLWKLINIHVWTGLAGTRSVEGLWALPKTFSEDLVTLLSEE